MNPQTKSKELLAALRSGDPHDQYLALSNLAVTDQGPVPVVGLQAALIVDAAMSATFDAAILNAVVSCLKSNNSDIRIEATKAISRIGFVAIPHIFVLLTDRTWDFDSRVATVVNLLSRIGLKDPEARILIERLKQPDMKDLKDGLQAFLDGAVFIDREQK